MKSFITAPPVALLIFIAGGWLFTNSASSPAPAPKPVWQATFLLILVAVTTAGAILGWRRRLDRIATQVIANTSPVKRDFGLICVLLATPFVIYNQFRIATTGHLIFPTKHGPNPHYYLTSTPISFTAFYIASACVLGLIAYGLALQWRNLRRGR